MIEKRFIKQVGAALSKLHTPVMLFDPQGECLYPQAGMQMEFTAELIEETVTEQGDLFLLLTAFKPQVVLGVKRNAPGAEDILLMVSAMVENMLKSGGIIADGWDVYRRTLREELSGSELDALANEHQIQLSQNRCALLFYITQTGSASAFNLLSDVIPQTEGDALVEMDRHSVVFLRDMEAVEDMDELRQFAEAVQETLMSETAHQMVVSIGMPKNTLAQLGESYREARRAMEVGRVFRPDESIFVFQNMMLERFLSELPREITAYYHSLLFNRKTQRLFNDEMLETIEMFFKKDLNLSDTARQLYIHRNTLVYRLDKVQRQIGLDLRNFEDAVTFKILLELKKSGSEKPRSVH
jgi:Sugar diacid utilization regulator